VEGPPKRLTVKEAESIALRNAPVLGSAYFNAQAAKDLVKEVRSQFFPQVEGVIEAVGTSNAIRNEFAGTNHTAPQIRIGASGALNNSLILSREAQGFNISQLIFDFGRTAIWPPRPNSMRCPKLKKRNSFAHKSFTAPIALI